MNHGMIFAKPLITYCEFSIDAKTIARALAGLGSSTQSAFLEEFLGELDQLCTLNGSWAGRQFLTIAESMNDEAKRLLIELASYCEEENGPAPARTDRGQGTASRREIRDHGNPADTSATATRR